MLENNFLEKQKESSTRQSIAAEQARMKKDSTAAETAKRRAARAAEVERCANPRNMPVSFARLEE